MIYFVYRGVAMKRIYLFFLHLFNQEPHYEFDGYEDLHPKNKKGLDELFSNSQLTPELLDKVGKGLNNLSNTAKGISDISSATLATDMYVRNLGSASDSMNTLAEINNKANESIHQSVGSLVESYSSTAQKIWSIILISMTFCTN